MSIKDSRLAADINPGLLQAHLDADASEIPPTTFRQNYYADRHHDYWLSGLRDYLSIMDCWQRYSEAGAISSYFDFGGSSGRVARHFASAHPDCTVYLSDLHISAIEWAREHLPTNVIAFQGQLEPSLPMNTASLNLISAFSVFTHIDTHERDWLEELRRVVRPSGLLYITAGTEEVWNDAMLVDWRHKQLARLHPEFAAMKRGTPMPFRRVAFPRMDGSYATVFHTKDYIRQEWGRIFDIKDIITPTDRISQSIVLMSPR